MCCHYNTHSYIHACVCVGLTGSDAVVDGCAVCGRGPRLRGSTDSPEAEGVASPREHPGQETAPGRPAVVRVDDGQLVSGSPLQVEVVVVGAHWVAPGDLQGGVGDSPEQEGGRRSRGFIGRGRGIKSSFCCLQLIM